MSDFDTTITNEEHAVVDPNLGKMSVWSVAALVCSLILCCPIVTVVGVILGIIGLFDTRGGRRRGRGLAIVGIVLGVLVTAAWVTVSVMSWSRYFEAIFSGPSIVMESGYKKDNKGVTDFFAEGYVPTSEEIDAFFTESDQRFGAFKQASPKDNQTTGADQQTLSVQYVFEFEKATVDADVTFDIKDKVITESGSYIGILEIKIEDPEGEDLILSTTVKQREEEFIDQIDNATPAPTSPAEQEDS